MINIINGINDYLWAIVIVLLIGSAIYFTIRSRGVQFRNMRDAIRITLGKDTKGGFYKFTE